MTKTVVVVWRDRFFEGVAGSREHEWHQWFLQSIAEAGMTGAAATRGSLLATVDAVRPDLVVVDEMGVRDGDDELLGDLWARRGDKMRVVGVYADWWMPHVMNGARSAANWLDAVWLSAVGSSYTMGSTPVFGMPFPYPSGIFRPDAAVERDVPCAFVGAVGSYNTPRMRWLSEMLRLGTPCMLRLHDHQISHLAASDYARLLQRVRVTVNFTGRTEGQRLLTGRALEAIQSGSLLLEEDNPFMPLFFTPGEHYIPFSTPGELDAQVRRLIASPDETTRITTAARAHFLETLTPHHVWGALFDLLDRSTAPPSLPPPPPPPPPPDAVAEHDPWEVVKRTVAEAAATAYPEPPTEPHASITKSMVEQIASLVPDGAAVLDVGCGQGLALDEFTRRGWQPTGVGVGPEDLDVCRSRGFTVCEMDQSLLTFPDEAFDLVWARHVLEHSVMPYTTLRGFHRVLQPGGLLYVEVPAPDTACHHETNPNHWSVLPKSMWVQLLIRAGYTLMEAKDIRFTVPAGPDEYWMFVAKKT